MRKVGKALAFFIALTVSISFVPQRAGAAAGQSFLNPGQGLAGSQSLELPVSPNGGYRLVMQTDGNLVLYRYNGKALWNSGTFGNPGAWVVMQTDGNLVIYNAAGTAIRAYAGAGVPNSHLNLQTDGNLVVYGPTGTARWNTGTNDSSGGLQLWCGYEPNRGLVTLLFPPADQTNVNTRASAYYGVYYWNNTATNAPQFVSDPATANVQIIAGSNTDGDYYAKTNGPNYTTAECPFTGGDNVVFTEPLLTTVPLQSAVGPHEFGHALGLSHWPNDGQNLPWNPVINPNYCPYTPLMWPIGDHIASCGRYAPVGVDIQRIARIYN